MVDIELDADGDGDWEGPRSAGKPGSLQSEDDQQTSFDQNDDDGKNGNAKVLIDFDQEPEAFQK